jgi:Glycosyltransferase
VKKLLTSGTKRRAAAHKPLRVLMVTGAYPTSQRPHWATFCKSQVNALRAAGIQVDVLQPRPGPAPLRYITAAVQVFLTSFSGKYDIIQGNYGLWCLVSRLQWTTAVVASYWGDDILGTITSNGKYSAKSNFVAVISRKLCYICNAIFVQSAQMKERAGGPQRKIHIIPTGIDFQQFQPVAREEMRKQLGWQQERYYVLFANNPRIPVKNFALAQAAVEQVQTAGKDIALVIANGLPHDTVMQYINASNALILSSHAEGSPNVVKEAMACNVPVVATDVGDVAAVIGRTAGCTVCTPGSIAEMARGITIVLAHTGRTSGRQDIRHLDNTVIAQQIIAVYEQITGRQLHQSVPDETVQEDSTYAHK